MSVQVKLEATTKDPGTALRAPTSEAGFAPACKDSCSGVLRLQMWEQTYDGGEGKVCHSLSPSLQLYLIIFFEVNHLDLMSLNLFRLLALFFSL